MKIKANFVKQAGTMLASGILLSAGAVEVSAQEPTSRTLERIYQIDERGDAQIEFKFQLGAMQWQLWKDQYGDHPDLMLRYLKHELAAAVIDDFSLEKDEIHRRATAKIKARSLASYRGNGQFQLQIPKENKLVANSGTEWVFTSTEFENGGIVNVTGRAKLPAGAQNAHLATGNDYNQLVYSIDVAPEKPKAFLYLGLLLVLIAFALGAVSFLIKSGSPPPLPA